MGEAWGGGGGEDEGEDEDDDEGDFLAALEKEKKLRAGETAEELKSAGNKLFAEKAFEGAGPRSQKSICSDFSKVNM
jgi:hypothetical protein